MDSNFHETQAAHGTGAIHEARWYRRFLRWNVLNIHLPLAGIFRGAANSDDNSFVHDESCELQRVALSQGQLRST